MKFGNKLTWDINYKNFIQKLYMVGKLATFSF